MRGIVVTFHAKEAFKETATKNLLAFFVLVYHLVLLQYDIQRQTRIADWPYYTPAKSWIAMIFRLLADCDILYMLDAQLVLRLELLNSQKKTHFIIRSMFNDFLGLSARLTAIHSITVRALCMWKVIKILFDDIRKSDNSQPLYKNFTVFPSLLFRNLQFSLVVTNCNDILGQTTYPCCYKTRLY